MHPSAALFAGEKPPVILPACDHYAGNLRFAQKALELQGEFASSLGPLFDITLDLEDGAAVGEEAALAETFGQLAASPQNIHGRMGLRVHAPHHPHFIDDLRIALPAAQGRLAYVMVPKVGSANDVANAVEAIERISADAALPAPCMR
jgi:citrate lyase subunit beta / citryl-CoA lyase